MDRCAEGHGQNILINIIFHQIQDVPNVSDNRKQVIRLAGYDLCES